MKYLQVFVSLQFLYLYSLKLADIMIKKTCPQPSLFSSLADQLNPKHPLYQLADKIDWRRFESSFSPLYSADNGRPAKPVRLMCGLLILKHVRNLSDESVVEQWSENAYYQYFCGMLEFTPSFPCNASELVHFRKRIGEKGMELILSETAQGQGNPRTFKAQVTA